VNPNETEMDCSYGSSFENHLHSTLKLVFVTEIERQNSWDEYCLFLIIRRTIQSTRRSIFSYRVSSSRCLPLAVYSFEMSDKKCVFQIFPRNKSFSTVSLHVSFPYYNIFCYSVSQTQLKNRTKQIGLEHWFSTFWPSRHIWDIHVLASY
jgi:hypothetical protein